MPARPETPLLPDEVQRILARPLPVHRRAAVIATTGEGRVITWNAGAERLFGWRRGEAVGRDIRDLTAVQQMRDGQAGVLALLQAGQPWIGPLRLRRSTGLPVRVFGMIFPIGDVAHGRGALVGVLAPFAQAGRMAGGAGRVQAELRRRAAGRGPAAAPVRRVSQPDPLAVTADAPIRGLGRIAALHRARPGGDRWRLMQRIETYRHRAELLTAGLEPSGRFRPGPRRLARMWLRLAERLYHESRRSDG